MNEYIKKAAPICLALFLSLLGVVAVLISEGRNLAEEKNYNKRKEKAKFLIMSALSQNLCLAAFSYDIWVVTTLFSAAADAQILKFYNLVDKKDAIQLLIVFHIILYLSVLAWGGLVRGGLTNPTVNPPESRGNQTDLTGRRFFLEFCLAILGILLCIGFQVY